MPRTLEDDYISRLDLEQDTGIIGVLRDMNRRINLAIRGMGVLHRDRHQAGGSDELDLTGLSGLLTTAQTPTGHATSHQNGGSDQISVAGLTGVLLTKQDADKLQGRAVHSVQPTAGQALIWDDANSRWAATTIPTQIVQVGMDTSYGDSTSQTSPQNSSISVNITTTITCNISVVASFRQYISNASYTAEYRLYRDSTAIGVQVSSASTIIIRGSITAYDQNVAAGTYTYKLCYWSSNASATARCGVGGMIVTAVPA